MSERVPQTLFSRSRYWFEGCPPPLRIILGLMISVLALALISRVVGGPATETHSVLSVATSAQEPAAWAAPPRLSVVPALSMPSVVVPAVADHVTATDSTTTSAEEVQEYPLLPSAGTEPGQSSPCPAGKVAADIRTGIYYPAGQRVSITTQTRPLCFDSQAQAQGAGYRRATR